MAAIGFAFIVVLHLVVVAGAVLTLFLVGALFDALDHPEELRTRIEGAFHKPPKPAEPTKPGHYYKPYWQS
jgi:NADH:ubiquinone oxidoreductase subunit 6 (subunit J)